MPYLDYIAPGLLASTALQVAMGESTWPMLGAFSGAGIYHAHAGLAAAAARHGRRRAALRLVPGRRVGGGVPGRDGGLRRAALVVGGDRACRSRVLLGVSVAAPVLAFAATIKTDNMFALLFRFAVIPMTLFAGVFFPVDQMPLVARWLAYVVAAVARRRAVPGGDARRGRSACRRSVHVGYLALWAVVGYVLARWRFRRRSSRTEGRPMVTTLALPRLLAGGRAPARPGRRGDRPQPDRRAPLRATGWWWSSGFFEPVLYLLVHRRRRRRAGRRLHAARRLDGRRYAAFVAPAMLAASAMNGAMAETTFNFFAKMKWVRLYDAMVATPLRPFEIAIGELGWALIRGLALLGGVPRHHGGPRPHHDRVGAAGVLPASMLVGFAFGAPGHGDLDADPHLAGLRLRQRRCSSRCSCSPARSCRSSPTRCLRVLVEVTPLYHGVELVRDITTGPPGLVDRSATSPTWLALPRRLGRRRPPQRCSASDPSSAPVQGGPLALSATPGPREWRHRLSPRVAGGSGTAGGDVEGVGGELATPYGVVPGSLLVGVGSSSALSLRLPSLCTWSLTTALALVVEPGRLGLHDARGLLHRGALPELAGLGDHLVELLPAGPGAEHIAHSDTRNEDHLATHGGSFLVSCRVVHPARSSTPLRHFLLIWRGLSVPSRTIGKPGGAPPRVSCTVVAAHGPQTIPDSSIGRATGC